MKKYEIIFGITTKNGNFIKIPQIEIKSRLIVTFKSQIYVEEARERMMINEKILDVFSLIGVWVHTSFGRDWRRANNIYGKFNIDFILNGIE